LVNEFIEEGGKGELFNDRPDEVVTSCEPGHDKVGTLSEQCKEAKVEALRIEFIGGIPDKNREAYLEWHGILEIVLI